MELEVTPDLSLDRLGERVINASTGDIFNTIDPQQFDCLKSLLVKHKKIGLRICLLDEDGYILRQVSSRSREQQPITGLNQKQKRVLKALERVIKACEHEKISLVGYSDTLVALPTELLDTEHASAEARELETLSVYIGADLLKNR